MQTKRVVLVAFGLVFLVFGAVFLVAQGRERGTEARLRERGVSVSGGVVHRLHYTRRSPGRRDTLEERHRWSLDVSYTAGDGTYREVFGVNEAAFDAHPPGSTVSLRIDPDDPGTARIEGGLSDERSSSSALLAGGIVASVVGLALVLGGCLGFRST